MMSPRPQIELVETQAITNWCVETERPWLQ